MIKLLDGSKRAVSRFDPVAKEFKPTLLGKKIFGEQEGQIHGVVSRVGRPNTKKRIDL